MFNWYLRWRHGKGFGVHSPFAFNFLRSALRESRGYAYYAYRQLPCGKGHKAAELRLLFRVLVCLKPHSICIDGCDNILRQTVYLACPGVNESKRNTAELNIVSETVPDTIPSGHTIILRPYTENKLRLWQNILQNHKRGMAFGGKHSKALIFVADARLPRQNFDLKF